MNLTDQDRLARTYEAGGVIRFRRLFSPARVSEIRLGLDRYLREVVPQTGRVVPKRDK